MTGSDNWPDSLHQTEQSSAVGIRLKQMSSGHISTPHPTLRGRQRKIGQTVTLLQDCPTVGWYKANKPHVSKAPFSLSLPTRPSEPTGRDTTNPAKPVDRQLLGNPSLRRRACEPDKRTASLRVLIANSHQQSTASFAKCRSGAMNLTPRKVQRASADANHKPRFTHRFVWAPGERRVSRCGQG
jgi:hypothetical protein